MKNISVFLADGFEEIEGLTVVDILRRAGVHVDTVSVTGKLAVEGSHHIQVKADILFEEMDFSNMDMLVLPGGMPGTLNLKNHAELMELLRQYDVQEKYIAAICAAPGILGELGFLEGRRACSYPSHERYLKGAQVVRKPAVKDGHIITGRGMGTAIPFALLLTAVLCGEEKAEEIKKAIVFC